MQEQQEELVQTWGYSGEVGSWNMELICSNSDELEKRFQYLISAIKKIIPPLKKMHTLHQIDFDLAVLGEAITEEGRIEEKEFFEFAELSASSLDDVVPAFEKLSVTYPRFIITRISMDLNTKVKEAREQEVIAPESAELYVSTDSYAELGKKDVIYISYSTYIDIWLRETLKSGVPRDNSNAAKLNYPRLEEFLITIEKNLGGSFEEGESYYYNDRLQRIGFAQK